MKSELAWISKKIRQKKKGMETIRMENLEEELWEAWKHHRSAEVHRITRAISGGRYGSKGRNYSKISSTLPTKAEWAEHWSKKAAKVEWRQEWWTGMKWKPHT